MSDQNIVYSENSAWGMAETVERIRAAIAAEGLGIVSELNVADTFASKGLGNIGAYLILGVCHPPSAHQLLSVDKTLGALLPCNVLIYEESGRVIVAAVRPEAMMRGDHPELREVIAEMSQKMERITRASQAV